MKDDYKSILIMIVGFLLLSYWLDQVILSYIATGIGVLSVLSRTLHAIILKLWFGLAKVLGYINSRILLSVVYVLILMPLAFLSRIFGNSTVQLKKKTGETYFVSRDHKYDKADLENPW